MSADLYDVDFYWESDQLAFHAVFVFSRGIDTTLSPIAFDDVEMGGGSAENPIQLEEEEDKENSSPPTTTPVSGRPARPPALLRSCPFGTTLENVPDYVYKNSFQ